MQGGHVPNRTNHDPTPADHMATPGGRANNSGNVGRSSLEETAPTTSFNLQPQMSCDQRSLAYSLAEVLFDFLAVSKHPAFASRPLN